MIQLVSKNIKATTQAKLADLQSEVNIEPIFSKKAAKAQSLWKNRTTNDAFNDVKTTLKGMCIFVNVCNYCE